MEQQDLTPTEHHYHSHTEHNGGHSPHIPAPAETAIHHQHHKIHEEPVEISRGLIIIAGLILLSSIWNFTQNHNLNGGIKFASGVDILLAVILIVPYELVRRFVYYCAVAALVIELVIGGVILKDRQSALGANNKSISIAQTSIQKSTSLAERQYYTKIDSELSAINKKLGSSYSRALSATAGVIGINLIAVFYLSRLRNRPGH